MARKATPKSNPSPRAKGAKNSGSPDWRPGMVAQLRRLIQEADPAAIEEQKWKKPSNPAGVPVWYHDGIVCHVVALKGRVRLTFLKGAMLNDPKGLYNACLDGNAMRAIDIGASDDLDKEGIKALVRAAVKLNATSGSH